MTDTEKRMRTVLTDTGLYSGEDKLFSAELTAYGAGLSMLFDAVNLCRDDLFVQTAGEEMLERFEKLFRVTPSSGNIETRRKMLLERGSVTPADNTRAALEKQLVGAGILGNIVENQQGGLYVNVRQVLGVSQETAAFEAESFLPAHLPCVLDFGVNTWDAVDERGMTFDEMDAAVGTWNSFDLL